uniref:Uncharacterized protein n=1 Tax=Arundo donax TaxID=35708 RepID=A0A0A9FGT3_ARUDO
MGLEAGVLSV